MAGTAQRIVFEGPRVVTVKPEPIPDPAQGQVQVRTSCSLVSTGTELAFFEGAHSQIVAGGWDYPGSVGYLNAGAVETVGANVEGISPGDRVVCLAGHVDCFNTPADQAVVIPDSVACEEAVFTVLGSVVIHALREANPTFGETVLVVGLGLIGQIAVRLLGLTPAQDVIAADLYPMRLRVAAQGGASVTVNVADGDLQEAVEGVTGKRGCDVVIDASGSPAALLSGLRTAANRGRIVIVGCPHGEVNVNLYTELQKKELSLIGSYQPNCPRTETPYTRWTQHRNRRLFLEYLARGRLDLAPLITHRARCSEAQAVYDALSQDKDNALGGLFTWPNTD